MRNKKNLESGIRNLELKIITGIIILSFIASCAAKTEPLTTPGDFVALLDYAQMSSGETYGAVIVISNNFKGTVKMKSQGLTDKMYITPKKVKEFKKRVTITKGDKIEVSAGGRTQVITIKYEKPQAIALGFVESKSAMFKNNTVFYATKGRGQYIAIYHIASKKSSSFGFPNANTAWYGVAFKNRITVSDKEGLILLKNKLKNKEIYYVTSYFYDSDYNYLGGLPGWEARYLDRE